MENIKNNYKALLMEYEEASQFYLRTGLTRLLAHALQNLEQFERAFVECYSLEELGELQIELNAQGLAIV
ncbi:hypothetical protein CG478_000945 [Bacillus cytotoxicus]|uniref:hypothetical protein n=1 Tax=Bacillus cytotoxicus TaxID=580165 RepID=UPI000B97083F|nr:hypothetical protein [Bacillus cytotoxicus]AWC27140.1 hypothetical protein CG483_000945 [Bacillus cytotoxicus]AWC39254.1 hypothetical protein CG480_000945 [Bacillus cytotoxicus]AWC47185.1 hypothetical protein CG478_000945 [Bacillus cytotoxicus]AWC51206.1 hypothetical protein CG477_000945 [Bacillus cytotoxicus]AWC55335.1 hypothetical protein CG476_000945 [Bacillus cytotoxicus]